MRVFKIPEISEFNTFFKDHGWIHIKNVFSEEEIQKLREGSYKMKAQNFKGDVLSFPSTSKLIYDDRIISVVRVLLETDKPVYFGDSSGHHIGNGPTGFHKDNPDKFNGENEDWQTDYSIIRLGIYCQSHDTYSGSVALRDKSHNSVNCEIGKPFLANNNEGDLLIWSLRTSHSGNSLRPKLFPDLFIHPWWYGKLPKFLFKGQQKERIAYFMTYGKDDNHLRRYLTYLLSRRYMVETWKQIHYSPELLNQVKVKNNLRIIDMNEVVKDIDINKVNPDHIEMNGIRNYHEPNILF